VRVYDTGTHSVAEALAQATNGRRLHRRPLTREEVVAAAEFSAAHAPLLALNFLPRNSRAGAVLSVRVVARDEARLAARRILDDHHRRGVALVPAGDWGDRVLAAFKQELQGGGASSSAPQ